MERLTIKYEGLLVPKKTCTIDRFGKADDCEQCGSVCCSNIDCTDCVIQECFTRLGEYEDTGITPAEILELKERNTPKEAIYEGDGYSDEEMVYDTWICPNCGAKYEVDYDDYDFCPDCGQMILR